MKRWKFFLTGILLAVAAGCLLPAIPKGRQTPIQIHTAVNRVDSITFNPRGD